MITLSKQYRITCNDVARVVAGEQISIESETLELLGERRRQITRMIDECRMPAYGFNRGFGHNVDNAVSHERLAQLQKNLIRSHAAGVGPDSPREFVRAAMLLRIQSLIQGHSGVRPEVPVGLMNLLNKGITPAVPMFGSVGASGDLCPLSHISLGLIGEGMVWQSDCEKPIAAHIALRNAGLEPLELEMKEGLALNNGVQFSTAIGVICEMELRKLLKTASIATALTAQVMLASDDPYLAELHRLRPHSGAIVVAEWIWRVIQGSPMRDVHRSYAVDGEVQDPYNLRCAAQVLGTCYDLLSEARACFEVEMNSATDNPLLLEDPASPGSFTRIISGGHFHGMPVAVKMYNLMQAAAIMSSLSNMRCVRYVDQHRNKGLGSDLIWSALDEQTKATCSGMMIPEYVSASLSNFVCGSAMPSHLFSLSTDAGQEDHVSMSAGLAVRVWETLPRVAEVLAIELAFASQAHALRQAASSIPSKVVREIEGHSVINSLRSQLQAEIQRTLGAEGERIIPAVNFSYSYKWNADERRASPVSEEIISLVREVFPVVDMDRELSTQLIGLAKLVTSGSVVALAESRGAFV
jgi:histidine ammonia-lyase